MEVIHTVSLKLHLDSWEAPARLRTVAIGQSIPAELSIQHTRRWSDPGLTTDDVLDFCFEVHASPDTWLIGGQRKAHFRTKVHSLSFPSVCFWLIGLQEHEIVSFPLLIVPQKMGHLLYPSVSITVPVCHDGSNKMGAHGDSDRPPHTSEVDYRNQGDSLLVISDLCSTTVGIDLEDAVTGAWLVNSQSRNGM